MIDGLTGAQRFFLSWAQAWQMKGRDEEVIRLLAIDPHSPNEFRCNQIVRNIDEFYTAFGRAPRMTPSGSSRPSASRSGRALQLIRPVRSLSSAPQTAVAGAPSRPRKIVQALW